MKAIITPTGEVRAMYNDAIKDVLEDIGNMNIKRASYVEPEGDKWYADLSLSGGPKLGPFNKRSEAISAEILWLEKNVLK